MCFSRFLILLIFGAFGATETIGASEAFGPITDDFRAFLNNQPRRNEHVLRQVGAYDATGSFGGRASPNQAIRNTPIIFIHGNSDSALKFGENPFQSGWNNVVDYFLARGYSLAELYGISYGDRDIKNSFTRSLNCADLQAHRRFIEAVLQYTGVAKVNVIAHSMGVTIARRVIKGGKHSTSTESCDLRWNLSNRVNTLISIASANYGMCACEMATEAAACGVETGYYPGTCSLSQCDSEVPTESCVNTPYSKFLMDLNEMAWKEAKLIASFWSIDDDVLKGGATWGKQTSLVPGTDSIKIFSKLNHNEVKTKTAAEQFQLIRETENFHFRGFFDFNL